MIRKLVREATCPVIALLTWKIRLRSHEAAKRGVFAYISNGDVGDDQLESAISIVLHRFAEYHDLQGAFGRARYTRSAPRAS